MQNNFKRETVMKTITIENHFKIITIAYEPKERVTRRQLTDVLQVAISVEKDYTKYSKLVKLAAKVVDTNDSILNNKMLLEEFKRIA
jgi:hypothetical protein